jgi:DnaK suppressor protein
MTHTTQSGLHDERMLERIRVSLDAAASSRQRQLDDLPPPHDDPVAGSQRASLQRILAEVRAAQDRLDTGSFGICQGCGTAIPVERLELRPWTPRCVPCAAGEPA